MPSPPCLPQARAAWSSWSRGADYSGHGVDRFSLRFKDERTEAEFARSSRATLLEGLFVLGCIVSLVGSGRLAFEWLLVDESDATYPESRLDVVGVCSVAVSCSLLLACLCKSRLSTSAPAFAVELAADLYTIVLMTIATFFQPQTMSRLRGHPLAGCQEDTALVLFLLGCILASNIVLPVRWHLAVPAQIAAVINFANHSFVVGGPSCQDFAHLNVHGQQRIVILLVLTFLIGAASKAKRVTEIQARKLFVHVIDERTRRVQSEFQLDQLQSENSIAAAQARGRRMAASELESLPATTTTARVFELDTEAGVDGSQLNRIAELGREEHWLIEPADLAWVPEQILGVGGFAILTTGTYLGKRVAVKVPRVLPSSDHSDAPVVGLCNELKILRNLVHPNIVSFYGACIDVQFTDIALVTELVNGLPLSEFVTEQPRHIDKARILREVSGALFYLHGQRPRVVHGDLKDTNILVQHGCPDAKWGAAKLLDFGLSRQITKRARPMGGSIRWMAPEVVLSGVPDMPADVFSFGRVAFFTLTGVLPADGKTPGEILMHLQSGLPPPLLWPPSDAFSIKYQDIICQCGMANSTMRPGIHQVQQTCIIFWRECTDGEDHRQQVQLDLHAELQAVRRTASLRESGLQRYFQSTEQL